MENIYSELNTCIVRFIIAAYEANDFRALKQLGLSDKQVKRVIEMPMKQFQRFNAMRTPIAAVEFNPRHFDLCVDYIIKESGADEIKDQMIQMDASAAMLEALTGMDIMEYRSRRTRLGLDKATQGRPASLTSDESITLSQSWMKFNDEQDVTMRYFKVGLDTRLPLNKVWAYMRLEQ
ncbi:MAG: DUF2857 family protein [Gammaproteobacteria bacterium]|nr:DUF2857 family protein [Gammaproteobacteria bacterium]